MSDAHNILQYGNNRNHWKILDLDLDLFIFVTLTQIVTRHTCLNTKP